MSADFAAIVTQTVKDGRALIESLMAETCIITRPDPDAPPPVFNNATGQYASVTRIVIYTGKCRVQIKSITASGTDKDAGDRRGLVQDAELQLPVIGTEGVAVNDEVLMTAATLDAALVGRAFTVAARSEKSQATSRRLRITEVTA